MMEAANSANIPAAPGQGEAGAGLKYKDADLIYTMPKRFLNSAKKRKDGQGAPWLWIMVGGAVLLVGTFIGLYVYLSQSQTAADLMSGDLGPGIQPAAPSLPGPDEPALEPEPEPEPAVQPDAAVGPKPDPAPAGAATGTPDQPAATSAPAVIDVSGDIVPAEPAAPAAQERPVTRAADRDNDGLSDLEELLLDANPDSPDTDQDGYDDRSELLNQFNPAGAGQPLIANPNIRKHSNSGIGYSLYHPLAWPADPQASDDSLIFRLPNNQFVQVLALENPGGRDLETWYKEQFNVGYLEPQQLYFKPAWSALRSPDLLNYYLANPRSDLIFSFSYNLGLDNVAAYITVFEAMVKSFDLGL